MFLPLPYLLRGIICTDQASSPLRYLQVQQESSALVGCVFGSLDLCVFRDVVTQQAETRDARQHIFLSIIHQAIRAALVGTNTGSRFLSSHIYVSFLVCTAQVPHTAHNIDSVPVCRTVFCRYIYIYQARSSSEMGEARSNRCRQDKQGNAAV